MSSARIVVLNGVGSAGKSRALGCSTVWIRRYGSSARLLTEEPDASVPDLRELVDLLGA